MSQTVSLGVHKDMSTSSVTKGLLAGAVGGLIASWGMNQFQRGWRKLQQAGEPDEREHGAQHSQSSHSPTVKVAEAVSEVVADHHLDPDEQEKGAQIVHYAFGSLVGGIYGMAAALEPKVAVAAGVPFGAVVWLLADEAMLPALGLSKAPTEYPPSMHAYALASHCVYGALTEMVRRSIDSSV